jgi:hypothetical protein
MRGCDLGSQTSPFTSNVSCNVQVCLKASAYQALAVMAGHVLTAAAIEIQAVWRGRNCRRVFVAAKKAALKLQARWRGCQTRLRFADVLKSLVQAAATRTVAVLVSETLTSLVSRCKAVDDTLRNAERDLFCAYRCCDPLGNPLVLPPVFAPLDPRNPSVTMDNTVFPVSVVFGVPLDTKVLLEDKHEVAVQCMMEAREQLSVCRSTVHSPKLPRAVQRGVSDVVIRRQLGNGFHGVVLYVAAR